MGTDDRNDLIELMESKNYIVEIDPPYINYYYKDLESTNFKINYSDIEMYFDKPDDLCLFLINRYEAIFEMEIERIKKVKFRTKRLKTILNNNNNYNER